MLLEAGVLTALAWPNHVHPDAARSRFAGQQESGWATCAASEAGFAQISCDPAVGGPTVAPVDAVALPRRLRRLETHAFRSLDRSVVELPAAILPRLQGCRQITDAVLPAATIRRGGGLATFDLGFAHLLSGADRHALGVIPV